jgi:hypothetical protein
MMISIKSNNKGEMDFFDMDRSEHINDVVHFKIWKSSDMECPRCVLTLKGGNKKVSDVKIDFEGELDVKKDNLSEFISGLRKKK